MSSFHSLWRTQNQPFLRYAQEKTAGSEHKLQQVGCPIDVKKQCFTMRATDQVLRKMCGISIFADAQCLTEKGPEQLVLNLGLPEQRVRLGDLRFRVNYAVCRHKFCLSCL